MEPSPPIHILFAHASEDDALLIERHLRNDGLVYDLKRVSNYPSLRQALAELQWDVLVVDSDSRNMNEFQVLEVARQLAPKLPCILISDQIGNETVVEAMRRGARDFISKFKLTRLATSIQREVRECQCGGNLYQPQVELQRAEHRIRAITAATLDGIVMVDAEGKVSFWNRSAERIFGYTESEALGSDLHALVAPERFQTAIRAGFAKFQQSGQGPAVGKVVRLEARRKDGSEFPAEISLAVLPEGKTWHAVGVVRDITESRNQEREQFEHLQFLRTLIETVPNPLYYEDLEGRILGCNRSFQDFLDVEAESVIGQKSEELLLGAIDDGTEVLEPNFLTHPGACETSFHMILSNGHTRHAIYRKAPVWNADGHPDGYVVTIMDITKLKETEEALRQNESLFSAIHRHVVDLIAIIDESGHRIYTSPSYQFVLGFSREEMSQLSSTDLLHPGDLESVSKALSDIMEGRPVQGLEYRLRHRDGRWLNFESKAAIISDPGADSVKALVVARDITERKEAEQRRAAMEIQLRQAHKLEAIGQLAAGIAHEINTPTQFIGDNTTFLRDACLDVFKVVEQLSARMTAIASTTGAGAEEAKSALAALEETDLAYHREEIPKAIRQSLDGVGRISKIVKAMKDFSHPGGDSKIFTDLHLAIESTITVSRNEWKYAANLITDFAPDMPPVPCFPDEFNQVILNLIVNAAHAIESAKADGILVAPGTITVKTYADKNDAMISVSDNGTGIPEAIQSRMFEPFFTTKPVGKGSGQGLAIVHAVIVEKHRGRIEVRSVIGQGTTFNLYLPLRMSGQEGGNG